MHSYLNNNLVIKRLMNEYKTHKKLIIAFDFDDTVFDLFEQGINTIPIVEALHRASLQGHILCMWTALPDEWSISYKKAIIKTLGINAEYINASPVMDNSRKPHFSILLDDRAGLASAYSALISVLDQIDILQSHEEEKSEPQV